MLPLPRYKHAVLALSRGLHCSAGSAWGLGLVAGTDREVLWTDLSIDRLWTPVLSGDHAPQLVSPPHPVTKESKNMSVLAVPLGVTTAHYGEELKGPTFPFLGGSILVSASFVWASSRSRLGMVGEADSLHFFPFFLLPSLSFRVLGGLGGLEGLGILDGLGIFTVLGVFFLDTFSRRDRGGVASIGDGGSSFSRSPSQTSSEEATAFTSGRTVLEAFWCGKRKESFVFPLDHDRTQGTLIAMFGEAVSPERNTQPTPCDIHTCSTLSRGMPHAHTLSNNIKKCSQNPRAPCDILTLT